MRILRTSSCCYCTDLRTGGLIIGFFSLFFKIANIFSMSSTGLSTCVFGLLVWGTWLYGIYNHKTSWMLPAMVVNIFALMILVIILILLPMLGLVFSDENQKALDNMTKQEHNGPLKASIILCGMWIFLALVTAIHYHFTSVMYSLYKNMTEYVSKTIDIRLI